MDTTDKALPSCPFRAAVRAHQAARRADELLTREGLPKGPDSAAVAEIAEALARAQGARLDAIEDGSWALLTDEVRGRVDGDLRWVDLKLGWGLWDRCDASRLPVLVRRAVDLLTTEIAPHRARIEKGAR